MKLPDSFAPLFRNYGFEKIDTEEQAELVVKTVLTRGSWDQVLWIFDYYGEGRIKEVFLKDFYGLRELPEPGVCLWGLLFLDEEEYWQERRKRENETRAERWRQRRMPPFNQQPCFGE